MALRAHQVPEVYVKMIKDMYKQTTTKVKSAAGITEELPLEVGVYQGSVLSPITVMNFVLRDLNNEPEVIHRIFADDVVILWHYNENLIHGQKHLKHMDFE